MAAIRCAERRYSTRPVPGVGNTGSDRGASPARGPLHPRIVTAVGGPPGHSGGGQHDSARYARFRAREATRSVLTSPCKGMTEGQLQPAAEALAPKDREKQLVGAGPTSQLEHMAPAVMAYCVAKRLRCGPLFTPMVSVCLTESNVPIRVA